MFEVLVFMFQKFTFTNQDMLDDLLLVIVATGTRTFIRSGDFEQDDIFRRFLAGFNEMKVYSSHTSIWFLRMKKSPSRVFTPQRKPKSQYDSLGFFNFLTTGQSD